MTSRALILDCDGVLADTERDGHLVAFNGAFVEADLPFRWSQDEYAHLLSIGGGKERLHTYLQSHPEIDLGSTEEVDALVRELHARKSQIYIGLVEVGDLPGRPGVRRLVGEALDAGWRVAVASTSALASVQAVLASVVASTDVHRISGVFAGDSVQSKKPAPDIYLLAARELNITADDVVVIEDSATGANAASAAGFRHLVTVSGFTATNSFPDAASVVDHLGDPEVTAHTLSGSDVIIDGCVRVASLDSILDLPAPAPRN